MTRILETANWKVMFNQFMPLAFDIISFSLLSCVFSPLKLESVAPLQMETAHQSKMIFLFTLYSRPLFTFLLNLLSSSLLAMIFLVHLVDSPCFAICVRLSGRWCCALEIFLRVLWDLQLIRSLEAYVKGNTTSASYFLADAKNCHRKSLIGWPRGSSKKETTDNSWSFVHWL